MASNRFEPFLSADGHGAVAVASTPVAMTKTKDWWESLTCVLTPTPEPTPAPIPLTLQPSFVSVSRQRGERRDGYLVEDVGREMVDRSRRRSFSDYRVQTNLSGHSGVKKDQYVDAIDTNEVIHNESPKKGFLNRMWGVMTNPDFQYAGFL